MQDAAGRGSGDTGLLSSESEKWTQPVWTERDGPQGGKHVTRAHAVFCAPGCERRHTRGSEHQPHLGGGNGGVAAGQRPGPALAHGQNQPCPARMRGASRCVLGAHLEPATPWALVSGFVARQPYARHLVSVISSLSGGFGAMPRVGREVDCDLCQFVCRMLCVQCWRAWDRPDGKGLVSSVALGKLVSP